MAEIAIGIDLGTSNSCVAVARGSNVEVLPNAYGESISASVVAFQEDGSVQVGNAAKANVIHDPMHTVSSAKRLIGRFFFSEEVKKAQAICSYQIVEGSNHSVRIQVRDEQFSLPEISGMVLREMKSVAEEQLGQEVRKAVITVPAYFNDNQRQATKDAGRIAGLEVLRLLNEPTAAALAYGFGRGLSQRVAVYDLGGGTFDISILEIGKDVFEVLSTCGDTYLGGDDFDDRIIDLLADEFMNQHAVNLRGDPYALEKLKLAAENAKKGLSVDDTVEVRIPDIITNAKGEALTLERSLTSQEFQSLVMDLLQRSFKVCDEALQQAGLVARDLGGVILVGGPTRLPIVREAVTQYFQQEPKSDVDPDEVVAMGAAIHASSLVGGVEENDAFLLDVTPLSLRIGVAGGMAETVIERNTPVPIEQSRVFTTYQDGQESVQIRVFQGESRTASENELLGQFEFGGFRKARRGEVQIEVTFEINSDGLVTVRACDQQTGQQASTTITLASGLSAEEMDQILDSSPADRVEASAPDESSIVAASPAPPKLPTAAAAAAVQEITPEPPPELETDPFTEEAPELEIGDTRNGAASPEPAPIPEAPASPEPAPLLDVAPDAEPEPRIEAAPHPASEPLPGPASLPEGISLFGEDEDDLAGADEEPIPLETLVGTGASVDPNADTGSDLKKRADAEFDIDLDLDSGSELTLDSNPGLLIDAEEPGTAAAPAGADDLDLDDDFFEDVGIDLGDLSDED